MVLPLDQGGTLWLPWPGRNGRRDATWLPRLDHNRSCSSTLSSRDNAFWHQATMLDSKIGSWLRVVRANPVNHVTWLGNRIIPLNNIVGDFLNSWSLSYLRSRLFFWKEEISQPANLVLTLNSANIAGSNNLHWQRKESPSPVSSWSGWEDRLMQVKPCYKILYKVGRGKGRKLYLNSNKNVLKNNNIQSRLCSV